MNKKLLLFLSIIISVVYMAAHLFFECRFKLDNITIAKNTDAGCVLVNDDDSKITFFHMSDTLVDKADGDISIKKFFESGEDGYGYNHPLCVIGNAEKVYLLNRKEYFSEREPEYEVCLLNFKKGKREVIFSFDDRTLTNKVGEYLAADKTNFSVSYEPVYQSFDVDDDGISICFKENKEDLESGEPETNIYKCKITGGEVSGAEFVSKSVNEYVYTSTVILNDNVFDFDVNYGLWINGEKLPAFSETRYFSIWDLDDKTVIAKSSNDDLYLIDTVAKTQVPFDKLNDGIRNAGLHMSDISDFYEIGNNTIVVFFDGEQSFLFSPDSGAKTYTIFVENAFELVVHNLIAIALAFAAVWLVGYLIYTLKTRGKVSAKFAAAAIPLILCCDLAAYGVMRLGISVIENDIFRRSLYTIANQQRSLGLTDETGDFDFNGEYKEEVNKVISTFLSTYFLNNIYTSEDTETRTSVTYLGYMRDSGIFVDLPNIIGGNSDYNSLSSYPSKTAEKITRAIENRSDEYIKMYMDGFECVALISPTYFNGDGSVNGVYIYSVSASEVHYNTTKLLRQLTRYKLILSAVIALLFTLFTWYSLRGLKKLQKKSADYLSGKYTPAFKTKISPSGTANEIDVISDKFDELLNSVNKEFSEIDNLRKANVAYFSDAILKIFNKKSINTVKLGEYAQAEAYCIKALLPEKYADFDNMNELLSALSAKLKEYSAFAADIDNTQLSIYSLEADSVNILFFLREYDKRIIAAADKCYIDISFINIGGSIRCMVQHEDVQRGEILMDTLINTRSSAVITEKVADTRSGELSTICVGMVDNAFIYDISDGIQKRFENSIRDKLKSGVELYFNGSYAAAREMFVIILKRQQDNPVARYYINLIDKSERKEGALQ